MFGFRRGGPDPCEGSGQELDDLLDCRGRFVELMNFIDFAQLLVEPVEGLLEMGELALLGFARDI